MVSNSKVIYLQKEDGRSIKAYVVSYLKEQTTGKTYCCQSKREKCQRLRNSRRSSCYSVKQG